MRNCKIKEVAKQLNVSQKTIRYYEQCGLIDPSSELKAGRYFRSYDDETIERLKIIVTLRKLQFPIQDIKEILEHPQNIQTTCEKFHNALIKQIGLETDICKLLEALDYSKIKDADLLKDEIEEKRKQMISDDLYKDYDLSKFDEAFTDYDLYKMKLEDHKKNDQTVASGYYFANPRVRSCMSGSSFTNPR